MMIWEDIFLLHPVECTQFDIYIDGIGYFQERFCDQLNVDLRYFIIEACTDAHREIHEYDVALNVKGIYKVGHPATQVEINLP